MMLTIDVKGVQVLLALLESIHAGHVPSDREVESVLTENSYFVDFYSSWEGSSREKVKDCLHYFDEPERIPTGTLPARLAQGFRQAVSERPLLEERLAWLRQVDSSAVASRVLAYLPDPTPLESTIHITIDLFNNAFVHNGEMGVSLLNGAADPHTFEKAISHELHHIGFRHWSKVDPRRQALLQAKAPSAVAVRHVENLLMEGMANYYLTPEFVFRSSSGGPPADPFQHNLARLEEEEAQRFEVAETVLRTALDPNEDFDHCMDLYKLIAWDLEEAMLPAGHYLGARMVQAVDRLVPRASVIECVQNLAQFLPLYNQAATQAGKFVFEPALVDRFTALWDEVLNPRTSPIQSPT